MKATRRIGLTLCFALSGLVPSAAFAQMTGQSMPLGMDMHKAAVGSYAEYEMGAAGMPPMKMRLALVGREGPSSVVETIVEGGMAAMMGGRMVARMVFGKDYSVSKIVMQAGSNDPMEMPASQAGMSGNQKLQKPDPKDLVGSETIKVRGGTFKTQHYRTKAPAGASDMWFSEEAPPFGLVKVEGAMPDPSGASQKVTMELVALGKNAKPSITKAPKPFDPAALMGGAAGLPGAEAAAVAAPGAAPAAAPPKKSKPTEKKKKKK